jgi:CRP/FNR family transcriptional regulator, cyclic AMP receptor protein
MGDDVILQRLSGVDLFSGLPQRELKRIAETGSTKAFPAGASVVEEGASVSGWAPFSPDGVCFYVILEGTAEVLVHGEPRATLETGQYFGETSLFDHQPRSATVLAGPQGMTAFSISAWDFAPILERNPSAAMAMLKVLAGRLRAADAR